MIKQQKGITLVSLIITIMLLLIISSTTINISLNRFKLNNFSKMKNDIIFLDEKVSNYYLKYGLLPILRENDGAGKKYNYTPLDFEKNSRDNENYYIIDLDAMDGIALNYGEEGFNKPNESSDVYIINEATHTIYYAEGIELNGDVYYYLTNETNIVDNIPPTKPEIKVISGTQNDAGIYTTEVQIEIVPGKDNVSGIEKTTYSINDGEEIDIATVTNNILTLTDIGTHEIKVKSYDKSGNVSEYSGTNIAIINDVPAGYQELEYIQATGTQYIDTGITCNDNLKIEVKYSITSFEDSRSYIFGARGSVDYRVQYSHTSVIFAGFGNMYNNNITAPTVNKQYYLVMDNGKFTLDGEEIYNATSAGGKYSSTNTITIALFALNANGTANNFGSNKIYECKIYLGETLVRYFIPCKNIADGAIGLYDTVNNVFYGNAATSGDDFTAGPEV